MYSLGLTMSNKQKHAFYNEIVRKETRDDSIILTKKEQKKLAKEYIDKIYEFEAERFKDNRLGYYGRKTLAEKLELWEDGTYHKEWRYEPTDYWDVYYTGSTQSFYKYIKIKEDV